MLLRIFRSNRPAVLLLLLVWVPALFLPGLWRMQAAPVQGMPLYQLLLAPAAAWSWWPGMLTLLLVALCSVQLTWLGGTAELYKQQDHLPAMLFPLLLAALDPGRVLEPALVGLPFVIGGAARAWSIATSGKVLARLFDAGVLVGVAALLHLPYAFMVVVLWASISVIRPFQWREYMLATLGVVTPLYLAWAVHHLTDPAPWLPLHSVISGLSPEARAVGLPSWSVWLVRTDLLLLGLVAVYKFADAYQRGVMREKNLRASFMAYFFASAVVYAALLALESSAPRVMVVAPLTLFIAYGLQVERRKALAELAVLLLLAVGLWARWVG